MHVWDLKREARGEQERRDPRGAIMEVRMQQNIQMLTRRVAGSRTGEGGGNSSPSQKGQGDEGHIFRP